MNEEDGNFKRRLRSSIAQRYSQVSNAIYAHATLAAK